MRTVSGRGHPRVKRDLVRLDQGKLRERLFRVFRKKRTLFDSLRKNIDDFRKNDGEPYDRFLCSSFGAEKTLLRELAEKLTLLEERRLKILQCADAFHMTPLKYCRTLLHEVTPETDFWTLLDRDADRISSETADWIDSLFQDAPPDDDFPSAEQSDDDSSTEDDPSSSDSSQEEDTISSAELKTVYRELCLRYHPDRTGRYDGEAAELWCEIQTAYADGDLRKLRLLRGGKRLRETDPSKLACSEILGMIRDLEDNIREVREKLAELRNLPEWNFSRWTAAKKKRWIEELGKSVSSRIVLLKRELGRYEKEIAKWTSPPKRG